MESSHLGIQVFANVCPETAQASSNTGNAALSEAKLLNDAQKELPTHASAIACKDGYKSEVMLFVDEDWMNMRSAREGKLGSLMWQPVVRFRSTDYEYVCDHSGPRIVQVGVGVDDHSDGLHFRRPSPPVMAGEATADRKGVAPFN